MTGANFTAVIVPTGAQKEVLRTIASARLAAMRGSRRPRQGALTNETHDNQAAPETCGGMRPHRVAIDQIAGSHRRSHAEARIPGNARTYPARACSRGHLASRCSPDHARLDV